MKIIERTKTTIKFNTGRWYAPEGQIISAEIRDYDHVYFIDHTRRVEGLIEYCSLTPHAIMNNYDKGFYNL